jgi:membrane protein DedA with SNARE-associated domain
MAQAGEPLGAAPMVMIGEAQRVARLAGGTLAVLAIGSFVGSSSALYLVNHHPLLLIALSPIGRHLLLVAPTVDPVAFVAVAVVRRTLFYLASFYLGRAFGPPGVLWIEARARRFGRFVRWIERLFARFGGWMVLFSAGPTVSALAGISGMDVRKFLLLAVPGLVARMLVVVAVAEQLREPIEAALAWIEAHWVPGTILLATVLSIDQGRRILRARRELARLRDEPPASEPPAGS